MIITAHAFEPANGAAVRSAHRCMQIYIEDAPEPVSHLQTKSPLQVRVLLGLKKGGTLL